MIYRIKNMADEYIINTADLEDPIQSAKNI